MDLERANAEFTGARLLRVRWNDVLSRDYLLSLAQLIAE